MNEKEKKKEKKESLFSGKSEVKRALLSEQIMILVLYVRMLTFLLMNLTPLCLLVLCLYYRSLVIYSLKRFQMDFLV